MRYGWLLVLCLAPSLSAAERATIRIPPECRTSNLRDGYGICWWCCAETVGRHHNLPQLHGLTQRVLETKIGLQGARTEDINHWMRELGLKPRWSAAHDAHWLGQQLDQGLPVIVTMSRWQNDDERAHAVLVLGVGLEKRKFVDRHGRELNDFPVTVLDPNAVDREVLLGWQEFWSLWIGYSYSFAPRTEDNKTPTPLHRESLAVPRSGSRPYVYLPPYRVTEETSYVPLQVEVVQADVVPGQPLLASNQDIQDGIRRPLDSLCVVPPGLVDYYRDFRQRMRR